MKPAAPAESADLDRSLLIIRHARQLLTMSGELGSDADDSEEALGLIADGALVCEAGKIIWAGETLALPDAFRHNQEAQMVEAWGKVVAPGLIDAHTHAIFGGDRSGEFAERCRGVSYREIARRGGGILATVRGTREATRAELINRAHPHLARMLRFGVTTAEVKSGYGLDCENEIKMLEAIRELDGEQPIALMPTFLGAHTFPAEMREDRGRYVKLLIEEMLPEVAVNKLARFCDVFIEEGAFTVEEARLILTRARDHGLELKVHADQLSPGGGAELAAELGAVSADHLEHISEAGIRVLAEAGVAAVLLPGAAFFINLNDDPPARALLEAGVQVAVATDFNPGSCMTENLPLIGTMACVRYQLNPAEVFRAVTLGGAAALGQEKRLGRLAPGYGADIVIFDMDDYRHLFYHFGVPHAWRVYKKGIQVYPEGSPGKGKH